MRIATRPTPRRLSGMPWIALLLAVVCLCRTPDTSRSTVDHDDGGMSDAVALSGLAHDLKTGFTLRQDTWGGDLPVGVAKRIQHQLFKDNDYRFCAWTSTKDAKISLHLCDRDGNVVENRSSQKAAKNLCVASAEIRPTATGSIYLTVKIDESPDERTPWGMVYAYR